MNSRAENITDTMGDSCLIGVSCFAKADDTAPELIFDLKTGIKAGPGT
jgi:hypothetical protein